MLKIKYYYPTEKYFTITVLPENTSFGSTNPYGTTNYLKNSSLSISAAPNSGYSFVQWSDGIRESSRSFYVTKSQTYTAQFTDALAPFTVTFNLNGHGSGNPPASLTLDSTTGFYATKPTDPTDTDYVFNGWFTTATGGSQWSFINDEVKCDMILYALWINTTTGSVRLVFADMFNYKYLLGYEYSGNQLQPKGNELIKSNKGSPWSIALIRRDVWNNPCPFIHPLASGWLTSLLWAKGSTYVIAVYEGNISAYSNLLLKGVSIDCVQNGALQPMHGTRVYDMPGPGDGYTAVTCKYYEFTIPNSAKYNTTINLIWEFNGQAKYSVVYDGNGHTGGNAPYDSNNPYNSGDTVIVKQNSSLTKSGYVFAGWTMNKDGSGTVYNTDDTFTISKDTVLYAKWVAQQ